MSNKFAVGEAISNKLVLNYPIVVCLFIRDLKKLHNPSDGHVPSIGAILFFEIPDHAYLEATN